MPQLVTSPKIDHYTCISWMDSIVFFTVFVLVLLLVVIVFLIPNISNYVSSYRSNLITRSRRNSIRQHVVNLVAVPGIRNGIRGFYVFDYSSTLTTIVPWMVKAHFRGIRTYYMDYDNRLYHAVFYTNVISDDIYIGVPINNTVLNFVRVNNTVITEFESLLTYRNNGYTIARIKIILSQ